MISARHGKTHAKRRLLTAAAVLGALVVIVTLDRQPVTEPLPAYGPGVALPGISDAEAEQFWLTLFGNEDLVRNRTLTVSTDTAISQGIRSYAETVAGGEKTVTLMFCPKIEQRFQSYFVLIVEIAPEDFQCHACKPLVAGAVFRDDNGAWETVAVNPSITEIGYWGQAPDYSEIIDLGKAGPGAAFYGCTMNQGTVATRVVILAPVGASMEVVFEDSLDGNEAFCYRTGGENTEEDAALFRSVLNVISRPEQTYNDLAVTGSETVTAGTDSGEGRMAGPEVYSFDGCSFRQGLLNRATSKPLTIQIGAFQDRNRGCRLTDSLTRMGFPAWMTWLVTDDGNCVFRVRIGSYDTRAEAEAMMRNLMQAGLSGIIVGT